MSQTNQIDLRNIFYIITIVTFLIGVLLLTLAEPFGENWAIGLGLIGAGIGFVVIIIKNYFKN